MENDWWEGFELMHPEKHGRFREDINRKFMNTPMKSNIIFFKQYIVPYKLLFVYINIVNIKVQWLQKGYSFLFEKNDMVNLQIYIKETTEKDKFFCVGTSQL